MDNETPQPNSPQPSSNQQPASQPPSQFSAGFGKGMKVIQPLNNDIKPESTVPQQPTQPTPSPQLAQPQPQTANTAPAAPTEQPTRPDTSSIYPDVTKGISATNYSTPSPADNVKDEKTATFSEGYSIGGTIFWYQLIAGIVFVLILYGIDSSLLKGATATVIAIVSLFYYLVEFFVVAYIPYNTLKNNGVEEPFWLTTFGVAVQSIILATLFELLVSLIIRSVINHGVSSSLAHIGGAGLGALAIVVYIGFFIASYFLTKLSWGTAFLLFGKIKNKAIVKAIGICVIAFIVGGIAYHYITARAAVHKAEERIGVLSGETTYQNNNNNSPSGSLSDPLVGSYAPTTVKAHDFTLSLNFDPNYSATIRYIPPITNKGVTTPQKEDVYITGNELGTADKMTIDVTRLGTNSGGVNPTECSNPNSTAPISQGINLLNYATVMGQKVAVCGFNEESTSMTAYFQTNGIYYSVDFGTTVGLSTTYSSSVQSILSSIQVQ